MMVTRPSPDAQDPTAWATLAWEGGVGPAAFARLLARFESARAVMEASPRDLGAPSLKLKPEQIASIRAAGGRIDQTAALIASLRDDGIAVICSFEGDYPGALRGANNPPPVICVRGRVLREDEPGLAIVGTRRPTREGVRGAREIARACAELGVTIISGLALGVDAAGHRGALDAGGRTIAVLGSGIRRIYPPRNRGLAKRIAGAGAIISEVAPDAAPSAARLLARNRLVAAMCRGLVAVEAAGDGGTMRTVRDARALGRLIFACDWQSDKPQADGTRAVLGMGAEPILGPDAAEHIVVAIRKHEPRGPAQQSLV